VRGSCTRKGRALEMRMGTTREPTRFSSGWLPRIASPSDSLTTLPMTRGFPSISLAWSAVTSTVATLSMQRLSPLLKAAVPHSRLQPSLRAFTFTRSLASIANHNTMPSTARPNLPPRQLSTTSGDYDSANPVDVRRQLGTYGLTPPAVESFEVQSQRCQ
jgi:hypothetical protein